MTLQDALFNWLQIKLVCEARPEDGPARETADFFAKILREDHGVTLVELAGRDETMIRLRYETEGKTKLQMFDREAAEKLLTDIEAEPRYGR